jgi:hypothetical protein
MSQSSNSTNLSNVFENFAFDDYIDEIFHQLPIKFTSNNTHNEEIEHEKMAINKLRWLIEYMVKQIRHKKKMKEMI